MQRRGPRAPVLAYADVVHLNVHAAAGPEERFLGLGEISVVGMVRGRRDGRAGEAAGEAEGRAYQGRSSEAILCEARLAPLTAAAVAGLRRERIESGLCIGLDAGVEVPAI